MSPTGGVTFLHRSKAGKPRRACFLIPGGDCAKFRQILTPLLKKQTATPKADVQVANSNGALLL
jgi:hypothetical protein